MIKKMVSLCLVAILAISLVGCSGSDDGGLEGTYLLSSMSALDMTLVYTDLEAMGLAEGTYLEFEADGTVTLMLVGEEPSTATYDAEAGTLVDTAGEVMNVTFEGDSVTLDLGEDGSLTFTLEGSDTWDAIKAEPSALGM